jgi:hypothetical protein
MWKRRKIDIIGVSPLDWPWYEKIDYLFIIIAKIVGIPQGDDQSVCIVHKQYEILNISDEDESFNFKSQERPTSPEMKTPAFGNGFVLLTFSFNTTRNKACKLLGIQGQPNKKFENK